MPPILPTRFLSTPTPLSFRPQPTLPSPLLPELVHLLPCLFLHTTCSLVPPSTRQLIMLLLELVHLLPCLFSPPTCSPVSLPMSSYPVNTIYYPLILPLLVNYFYHLTFLSVLVQNTATQILPFLSPTSTVKNITTNKTSH